MSHLYPVPGVLLGPVAAGIRKAQRRDLLLITLPPESRVGAVFTQNRFCAAPVQVCREHLRQTTPRALIINTGCANAGTGHPGLEDARATCSAVGKALGIAPESVLPFSTGVILERLPMARLLGGVGPALSALQADQWAAAA